MLKHKMKKKESSTTTYEKNKLHTYKYDDDGDHIAFPSHLNASINGWFVAKIDIQNLTKKKQANNK